MGDVILCTQSQAKYYSLSLTMRSLDRGKTWKRLTNTNNPYSDIIYSNRTMFYFEYSMFSSITNVYSSTNFGESWTQISSIPFNNENGYIKAACENGIIVVICFSNTIYVSEDEGYTWNAYTCPIVALTVEVHHGNFLVSSGNAGYEYAASKDGKNWFIVEALAEMTSIIEDKDGVVGYTKNKLGEFTLVRVTGDNLQIVANPKKSYNFSNINLTYFSVSYSKKTGIYIFLFDDSLREVPTCWYSEEYPYSDSSLFSESGAKPVNFANFFSGFLSSARPRNFFYDNRNMVFLALDGDPSEGWLYDKNSYFCLNIDMLGSILSEQLYAAVRHKGEKSGWSEWSEDLPFKAKIELVPEIEGLEQKDGVTYVNRKETETGYYLSKEFTVPEGVKELLVLCASGVNSNSPGWAASCRVHVTPGQTIPVEIGGYDSASSTIRATSRFGSFISCDPDEGVICPEGKLMEFQGAEGVKSGTGFARGGGFAFLTDYEWRKFALVGTEEIPTKALSTIRPGYNVGWNLLIKKTLVLSAEGMLEKVVYLALLRYGGALKLMKILAR